MQLYQNTISIFGSEYITLKFNIDKSYIENELRKYKFIKIKKITPFNSPATDNYRINLDGFTLYIINDKDTENPKGHEFPYHYGIGVNKEFNQIVYYYTCRD